MTDHFQTIPKCKNLSMEPFFAGAIKSGRLLNETILVDATVARYIFRARARARAQRSGARNRFFEFLCFSLIESF